MAERLEIEILLVEDNMADAELALHAFKKNKIANHVLHVQDGAEALDLLFSRGSYEGKPLARQPRLILLDLKLPKVDGLQVLKELKGNPVTKAIPIILLTSSNEERDLVASYQLGVNSYIQKPVNFVEFQEVVRQLGMYWLMVNKEPPASAFLAS
jgi:two-component system, response regulator